MSFYNENYTTRILELLNYPIIDRCPELGLLFDRCSIRELQEIFPTLVNSIFGNNCGGLGWCLRTTTKENSSQIFDILYNFFGPLGPMFRLCYRLLNDAVKFELNVDLLPHKLCEMLHSGQYSMFYSDLITIDPFRRAITSLSLNAFDYFIANFVIHGTLPLHRLYPAALQVHNERSKTVYFFLTADYLCSFLPSNPDAVVMPTNICETVKAPQPMPVQPLQPARSPKYLKLSPVSSHFISTNQTSAARTPESPRAHAWRTESVLYLFVDTWLRFDIDETRDLPSSEFIRVVRILVKQLHAFGNSADLDQTSMSILRKLSQPMMKARIYPFLKSIIARWPLDSSMSVVLELWLSYIQPWRYTFDRNFNNPNTEVPFNNRYEAFISDNLVIYTQIFVQILPRFERLDFTSFRNVVMLHRLVKVFSLDRLPHILINCEQRLPNNFAAIATSSPSTRPLNYCSPQRMQSGDWDSFRTDNLFHDENYTPMFGNALRNEINQFLKSIIMAKLYVKQEIESINQELAVQRHGFNYLKHLFFSLFEEISPAESKLFELRKIPDILDLAVQSLAYMFELDIPDISIEHVEQREITYSHVNLSCSSNSDFLDISKISPMQMRNAIANIKPTIDPALLPIQSHECAFLVRFLHQVSCKLNIMFSDEMSLIWNRGDIWGKLSRQILSPPMTTQWFDKVKGINELREEQLPPRICLRVLASYKTLVVITISLIFGQLSFGVPSFGLLLLIFMLSFYLFILTLIT